MYSESWRRVVGDQAPINGYSYGMNLVWLFRRIYLHLQAANGNAVQKKLHWHAIAKLEAYRERILRNHITSLKEGEDLPYQILIR